VNLPIISVLVQTCLELLRDGGPDSTAPVRVVCDHVIRTLMADFMGNGSNPARPQILAAAEDARHRWLQFTFRLLRCVLLYHTV
jgi:hypothetical protein